VLPEHVVDRAMARRAWQLASVALMNVPLEACSAGTLLRTFKQVVSRNHPRVGFPGCGLGDLFVPAARERLRLAGHRVLLDTEVATLLGDGVRAIGARLADGRELRARQVVSALPPTALSAILPPTWRRGWPGAAGLDWFRPVSYVSVYLWLDRRITERPFWARPQHRDALNCDFYDYGNIYPGWEHRGSLIASNIVGAERAIGLSDDEIVARTRAELVENHPLAAQAQLLHAAVHRIPLAVVAPSPGFERHRLPAVTPIDGLTLAGDWTRTRLPSSMESAVASGFTAAEQVLASMRAPRALRRELPPPGLLAQALAYLPHLAAPTR
jgi:15-cis-phytoene desaturase